MITETDELERAIAAAAALWPTDSEHRTALVRHILDLGVASITELLAQSERQRTATLNGVAGSLTGVWPTGWREEIATEWPA